MVLPCQHLEGHMYRARHRDKVFKYCMLCMFEKIGMWEIGNEPEKVPERTEAEIKGGQKKATKIIKEIKEKDEKVH